MRRLRSRRIPLHVVLVSAVVIGYLLAPMVVVIMAGLSGGDSTSAGDTQGESSSFQFPPKSLSLRYTEDFLSNDTYRDGYLTSLQVALATTVIVTVLGILAAYGLVRGRARWRPLAEALFLSPLLVPGILISFALASYLGSLGLRGSMWSLVIAAVIVTAPYAVGAYTFALGAVDLTPERVARTLGAGPVRAFVGVTLRTLRPVIVSGMMLTFILAFGTFDAFLFLTGFGAQTLTHQLFASLQFKFDPTAAGAGVFAILLVVGATLVILMLVTRKSVIRTLRRHPTG